MEILRWNEDLKKHCRRPLSLGRDATSSVSTKVVPQITDDAAVTKIPSEFFARLKMRLSTRLGQVDPTGEQDFWSWALSPNHIRLSQSSHELIPPLLTLSGS
ncbi:unnamed protein product [Durusdinium trenchii]|uniref:Uncharacterized protein n=1 Tax=Durusdinium trenchii TaxID=1381693 RepID=A0ABP0ILV8_9DINO